MYVYVSIINKIDRESVAGDVFVLQSLSYLSFTHSLFLKLVDVSYSASVGTPDTFAGQAIYLNTAL